MEISGFYKESSIDIIEDEVFKVDFAARTVSTTSGTTYDTRNRPSYRRHTRWLPLPGLKGDLGNVFVYVRSLIRKEY